MSARRQEAKGVFFAGKQFFRGEVCFAADFFRCVFMRSVGEIGAAGRSLRGKRRIRTVWRSGRRGSVKRRECGFFWRSGPEFFKYQRKERNSMAHYQIVAVDSMEKIFPDTQPKLLRHSAEMLKNERYSFQLACYSETPERFVRLRIDSPFADRIRWKAEEYVPVYLAAYPESDDYLISRNSGIFPDVLREPDGRDIALRPGKQTPLFVEVKGFPPGMHRLGFALVGEKGEELCSCEFTLTVLDAESVKSDLIWTNWLHCDCIGEFREEEFFSERYFGVWENYVRSAVEHGATMLFTPLFTPPLDTAYGYERPTVQTVGVKKSRAGWEFDLSVLEEYIDRAFGLGIGYIEFSHLFSQWGAEFAPKIVGTEEGVKRRFFGWDTPSDGEEYLSFLDAFLPCLTEWITRKQIADRVFFHLSDEPPEERAPAYDRAAGHVRKLLRGFRIMDALSDKSLYESGIVDCPVVNVNRTESFIREGISPWAYYCCDSGEYCTNRWMSMPLQRVRVLGIMLYYLNIRGFLHWGFNFYFSQLSKSRINPYLVTDAGGAFPAGDAFVVYPGTDGPVESLRHEALLDAVQDYRALRTLEKKIGRAETVRFLQEEGVRGFREYPRSAEWHAALRHKINCMLTER